MSLLTSVRLAFGFPMIDALEELLRKIRPYELEPGSADRAFEEGLDAVAEGLRKNGISGARKGLKRAIDLMCQVKYDRTNPRPRVLIVGEYLLNFHPGANHDIEAYLEKNGFEIIEAKMTGRDPENVFLSGQSGAGVSSEKTAGTESMASDR